MLVSSTIFINNHKVIFAMFIITSVSWGATINLTYRFGNIMPSDIALSILLLSMFISSLTKRLKLNYTLGKRMNVLLIALLIMYIFFGLIKGYEVYNIAQDLKLFLYIYIPFIYLSSVDFDNTFVDIILSVVQTYIIIVFFQEVRHFNEIGLNSLVNYGFGGRDVGIIVHFIPLASSVLILLRKRISSYQLFSLQIMSFLACLLSFTRTIWIAYIISILILISFTSKRITIILRNLFFFSFFLWVTYLLMKNIYPDVYNSFLSAIISRVTDSTNSVNTLDHRLNSAGLVFKDKVARLDSIFGSGFGEVWEKKGSVFIENSFFYYVWKYGIIITGYFTIVLIANFLKSMQSGKNVIKVISLNLLTFICIGNFSGNLNIYYCVPLLSFVFAYKSIIKNRQKLVVGSK